MKVYDASIWIVAVLLLLFLLSFAWEEGYLGGSEKQNTLMQGESKDIPTIKKDKEVFSKPVVEKDEILSVSLKDVNFWEARFNVRYKHKTGRRNGYLQVNAEKWTPNAGLITSPGERGGVTLSARVFGRANAYTDQYVTARMYDPYKNDIDFAEARFPMKVEWPDIGTLPAVPPENKNRFSDVNELLVYRNVPNYVHFAEKLTQEGFPAEKITMMLAVCRSCKGQLFFGGKINKNHLQSILRILKEINFPLENVSYIDKAGYTGKIYIGASPAPNSKPLWININQLLTENISEREFFNLLGYPALAPTESLDKRMYIGG